MEAEVVRVTDHFDKNKGLYQVSGLVRNNSKAAFNYYLFTVGFYNINGNLVATKTMGKYADLESKGDSIWMQNTIHIAEYKDLPYKAIAKVQGMLKPPVKSANTPIN